MFQKMNYTRRLVIIRLLNVKAVSPFQIEGDVVQIGKIVIVNLMVTHSQSNTKYVPKQDDLFVTGLSVCLRKGRRQLGYIYIRYLSQNVHRLFHCIIRTVDGIGALSYGE